MAENTRNAVAIINDQNALRGILTDHDVMRALHASDGHLGSFKVCDWMTANVITCTLDTKLSAALRILGRHRIRHLVVIEGEKPIAVVGAREILGKLHDNDVLEINTLRDIAILPRAGGL